MNIVKELREKKGIQQKELAIEIGVSSATVSDWEHQRKNPSGERLRRLSDFFGVAPDVILGVASNKDYLFVPEDPKISGKSETEQIIDRILKGLGKTPEAQAVSSKMDALPKDQRKMILNLVNAICNDNTKA